MESIEIVAGETLENLDTTTTKINDSSHILNYNITKEAFEVANTGKVSIIKKNQKESKGGKRDDRKLKEKLQIDVLCDQSLSNYYYPKVGDLVIGKITSKFAFSYDVDINAYNDATLDALEFDGATRRNKPNLDSNMLVYCRVKAVDHFSKPVLSCISPIHKKAWTTGESYFGQLKGGYMCEASKKLLKYLQSKKCYLLNQLGELFEFEIIVGFNGRVWVNCKKGLQNLVVIINCINKGDEYIDDKKKVDKLIEHIRTTVAPQ